jgi:hypothetical protein
MLGGVMLATNASTSAVVVGPEIPEAELLVVQLLSLEHVAPLTAAYLVASLTTWSIE